MQPPDMIIAAMLRADTITGMSTTKALMKNARKKNNRNLNPMKKNKKKKGTASGNKSSSSISSNGDKIIPSFTQNDIPEPPAFSGEPVAMAVSVDEETQMPGVEQEQYNQIVFPGKENRINGYALQLTPSGQVKQISPNDKICRTNTDSESPFVYASISHTHSEHGNGNGNGNRSVSHATFQSAIADDFLPIHIACLYRASPAVIALLIKCHPEGVEHKNKWGMLPIHVVCSNYSLCTPAIMASKLENDFDTKAYLNNLYSESMEGDEKPWEITEVVNMLVKAFPPCVHIPSDNIEWYTPLEYATRNIKEIQERDDIVEILKKAQEQQHSVGGTGAGSNGVYGPGVSCDGQSQSLSSSLSDSKASTGIGIKAFPISDCPLLYTYISGKQWDRVRGRVEKVPEEASYWIVDTDYPRLPIHLACTNDAPKEVVIALLDAYHEGCVAKEGSGSYPLHLACGNGLPLETIKILLNKSRKATRMKDDFGRLPLHLACANGAHLQVVKALIDAYPGSCSMKDYNGHTALTYVDNSDHEDTVKDQFTALFEDYEDRISGKDTMQEDAMCKEEDLDNQTTKDSSEAWC
jgi:hypothetical protein